MEYAPGRLPPDVRVPPPGPASRPLAAELAEHESPVREILIDH